MDENTKETLKVQGQKGETTPSDKTYIPVNPAILDVGKPPPFHLYCHVRSGRLDLLSEAGETISPELMEMTAQYGKEGRLYVRVDQREDLIEYQKAALAKMLDDDEVPVDVKCDVLQNQTSLISQQLFENPTAPQIRSQRENIRGMVDLVFHEPAAMRGLLGLTHYDYYTYTHSVNVGLYGLWLLTNLYKDSADVNLHEIATSFFLHDVGKSAVDQAIINKPGRLTEGEWLEIRKHPAYGCNILSKEKNLTEENNIVVFQHHERMDGEGYPKGLLDEEIHPYARICSVADAFDALTTRRSYKPALTHFDALAVMKKEMSAQFDPEVFKTLVLLCKR